MGNGDEWGLNFTHLSGWGWMGMNGYYSSPLFHSYPCVTMVLKPYHLIIGCAIHSIISLSWVTATFHAFNLVDTSWRIPTNVDEWGWMWMNGDECGWMGKNGDEKIGRGYYSSPFVPIRMNGWNLILLGHGILQLGHEKIPQPSFGRSKRNIFQREVGTRTLPWPRSA